jgi:hypothetical protein
MKWINFILFCLIAETLFSQSIQLHYDMRHTVDPKRSAKNFPTLYFEYFKNYDSGNSVIKPGSFLLQMHADFTGEKNNMGQFYMQVSQTLKCWKPNFFLNLQYSGGLGVTEPKQYSFYITNTYCAGIAYPFKWGNAYMTTVLNYKYVAYSKGTNDFLYTLYWWKGLWNYKAEVAGDFSLWTENKDHGDELTTGLHGKRFFFFAEPQFWYNLSKILSVGSKVNMYYHVLMNDNSLQVYPTVSVRCKL